MTARLLPRILCDYIRRPNFKPRHEMRVPDKWLDYSKIGEQMPDLPFICFKTPLSEGFSYSSYNKYGLTKDEEFTPTQLYDEIERRGIKLGIIIDLTNTYRYYDGRKEFEERFGIKYAKIKFDAYNSTCFTSVFNIFAKCVRQFLEGAQPDEVIGVHCTHGIHRTGYMICRYLIEEHNYNMEHAINIFNKARGHDMEKYLEELKEIWMEKSGLGGTSSTSGKRPSRGRDNKFHIVRKGGRQKSEKYLEKIRPSANDTVEVSGQSKEVSAKEVSPAEGQVNNIEKEREHCFANDSIDDSELVHFDDDEQNQTSIQRTRAL